MADDGASSNCGSVDVSVSIIPTPSSSQTQIGANSVNEEMPQCSDLLLPEEVWRIILEYLVKSKDLLNASNASPIFNQILCPKKSMWMFEQVLPHIFKDLRKSDLMTLRLVCKAWNQAIDNYVAGHPSLHPFNEQTYRTIQSSYNYLPLSTKVYDDIAFVNSEQFADFMHRMKGHPRNPFFGRSVRIGSCGDLFDHIDEVVENTWKCAEELCQQFGSHLWHLEFANYEFSLSTLEFYKGIRKSLAHVPNLRALHMNGALDAFDEDDSHLLEFMEANPLPPLPHLESIIFDLVMETEPEEEEIFLRLQDPNLLVDYLHDHPEAIQQLLSEAPPTPDNFQDKFITTYGGQLKKLEIDLPSWRDEYASLLVNLTEIHLKHVKSIAKLKAVLHGLKAGHGLGKLIISLRCSLKTTELFELLEPLKILNLDFGYLGEAPDDYLVESKNDVLPCIPSLLLLRVKDTVNMTFEFLKNLSSLEHLDVWECQNARKQFHQERLDAKNAEENSERMETGATITEELRKLIYGEDMENAGGPKESSNIWQILPSLKLITYRTRSGLPSVIKRFARDSYSWEYICSY